MTAEIPDDIMQAAEKALDNLLCNCVESCGSYDALRQASITDIARAILAEREAQERLIETLAAALEDIRDMPIMDPVAIYDIARTALAQARAGKHRNPS